MGTALGGFTVQTGLREVSTEVITNVAKYQTYEQLAKITAGWKGLIQAHHIVEARHLEALGLSIYGCTSCHLRKDTTSINDK